MKLFLNVGALPVTMGTAAAATEPRIVAGCDKCDLLCFTYKTDIRYKSGVISRNLQADLTYNSGSNTPLGTVYLTNATPDNKIIPEFHVCVGLKDAKAGYLITQLHSANTIGVPPAYYERIEKKFEQPTTTIHRILPFDP